MRTAILYSGVSEKSYDGLLKYSNSEVVEEFLKSLLPHYRKVQSFLNDFPIEYWNTLDAKGLRATDEQIILHQARKELRKFYKEHIKDVKSNAKQDIARKNSERLQDRSEEAGTVPSDQ